MTATLLERPRIQLPTPEQILAIAASQIGVEENPHGSNRVRYSSWYGLVGPWCAMFTSWVLQQAGLPRGPLTHFAYTPAGESSYRRAGRFGSTPRPGALVFFNFIGRTSHIGFVEAVLAGGLIRTIEGNTDAAGGRTGGRVMRQTRSRLIVGYGYPPLAASPSSSSSDLGGQAMYRCKQGDKGEDVELLQRRLVRAGQKVAVDREYGDETARAVATVTKLSGKRVTAKHEDRIEDAILDRRVAAAAKPARHDHKATIRLE